MHLPCPTCRTPLPAAAPGRKVRCRDCGQRLFAPAPGEEPVLDEMAAWQVLLLAGGVTLAGIAAAAGAVAMAYRLGG